MEAMSRAIEDASDFMEMKRKLLERNEQLIVARERGVKELLDDMGKLEIAPNAAPRQTPKQPGENREQYRARIHGKAVTK